MRRLAGGDTYTIIYLKMQLLAMKTEGILQWTGLENDFASELALDLDEDPQNVAVTLQYLLSCGLAETNDNTAFFFPYAVENTGSETSAAQRMRTKRAQIRTQSEQCSKMLEQSYGEKEIEYAHPRKKSRTKSFVPPTLEEVRAYCEERGSPVDPQKFFDYFSAGNWTDSEGKPVKSWKQKLITWEGREKNGRAKPVSNHAEQNTEELKTEWGDLYDNERIGRELGIL